MNSPCTNHDSYVSLLHCLSYGGWGVLEMDTYRIPFQGLGCDAERSAPLLCAAPIFGAHPASSPLHLQLALQIEYIIRCKVKTQSWTHMTIPMQVKCACEVCFVNLFQPLAWHCKPALERRLNSSAPSASSWSFWAMTSGKKTVMCCQLFWLVPSQRACHPFPRNFL